MKQMFVQKKLCKKICYQTLESNLRVIIINKPNFKIFKINKIVKKVKHLFSMKNLS